MPGPNEIDNDGGVSAEANAGDGSGGGCAVTAVKAVRNDPMRVAIHVDGRKRATMSLEQSFELGLRAGVPWTPELAKAVDDAVGYHKTRRDALRVVRRRMIGTGELAERLKRREHAGRHIQRVIGELTERRLLDDATYGRSLIEKTRLQKPAGRRLLQQKLTQRKLPKDLVERLLDDALADADPHTEARALAAQRLETGTMMRCDPVARRRRLVSLLTRRGFDLDAIHAALAEHEDALNAPPTPSARALMFDDPEAEQVSDATDEEPGDNGADGDGAYASALALIEKKLAQPSMQKADAHARRRRLTGMLARRGHGYDVIQRVFEATGV